MSSRTCQQIEDYIANSFLLGISKEAEEQYTTINDLRDGWKKKTLGNMLRCIERLGNRTSGQANFFNSSYEQERAVHGLTTNEQFDIRRGGGNSNFGPFSGSLTFIRG